MDLEAVAAVTDPEVLGNTMQSLTVIGTSVLPLDFWQYL